MKERSLVVFTILMQSAVGVFILSSLLQAEIEHVSTSLALASVLTRLNWLAAPLLAGLGILISMLHLGTPLNAWRALSNLRNSWLSREILLAGLFSAGSAGVAVIKWNLPVLTEVSLVLESMVTLIGIGLVYSMARVYMLPATPGWNRLSTPLAFFLTTFLVGGSAATCGVAWMGERILDGGLTNLLREQQLAHTSPRQVELGLMVLLILQSPLILAESKLVDRSLLTTRIARLRPAFVLVALASLALQTALPPTWRLELMCLAGATILASEAIGRLNFYDRRKD